VFHALFLYFIVIVDVICAAEPSLYLSWHLMELLTNELIAVKHL